MSDTRTCEECLTAIDAAHLRLIQLRTEDPLVYGIKQTWKGETRYHTCVKGENWRQLLTTVLDYSALWLAAFRPWAEEQMYKMAINNQDAVYEIVEIPKADLPNMLCWKIYGQYSEFGGTQC